MVVYVSLRLTYVVVRYRFESRVAFPVTTVELLLCDGAGEKGTPKGRPIRMGSRIHED